MTSMRLVRIAGVLAAALQISISQASVPLLTQTGNFQQIRVVNAVSAIASRLSALPRTSYRGLTISEAADAGVIQRDQITPDGYMRVGDARLSVGPALDVRRYEIIVMRPHAKGCRSLAARLRARAKLIQAFCLDDGTRLHVVGR